MEREMQMQTMKAGNPGGNGDGPEREMLLADVIYVFFDKNESGIVFYDHTVSEKPEGVYVTDMHSLGLADWNDQINEPGKSGLCRSRLGVYEVKTIMVSKKRYFEICDEILSHPKDEEKIEIDTRDRKLNQIDSNNSFDNYKESNYADLIKLRENLILNMQQYNNEDPSKNDMVDGFGPNRK